MRSSTRKKKSRSFLDPGQLSTKEKVFSKKKSQCMKAFYQSKKLFMFQRNVSNRNFVLMQEREKNQSLMNPNLFALRSKLNKKSLEIN